MAVEAVADVSVSWPTIEHRQTVHPLDIIGESGRTAESRNASEPTDIDDIRPRQIFNNAETSVVTPGGQRRVIVIILILIMAPTGILERLKSLYSRPPGTD